MTDFTAPFPWFGGKSRVAAEVWQRLGPDVINYTAVFLDPPYSAEAGRDNTLYSQESLTVAHDVCEWAIANGDNPLFRIALCGYDTEHAMPDNWTLYSWKTNGGYANRGNGTNTNASRETVWFSPHCLTPHVKAPTLFDFAEL